METFYLAKSTEEALAELHRLKVKFVQVPEYSLPPEYNSQIMEILSNPSMSQLLVSVGGNQVFRLFDEPLAWETGGKPYGSEVSFGAGSQPWTLDHLLVLGGRNGVVRVAIDSRPLPESGTSRLSRAWPAFRREISSVLVSGKSTFSSAKVDKEAEVIEVKSEQEYLVEFDLTGEAFAQFFLLQFDAGGAPVRPLSPLDAVTFSPLDFKQKMGEIPVSTQGTPRRFSRRFRTYAGARYIRFGIEHRGHTWLRVHQAKLVEIVRGPAGRRQ
jgi:hypothetical protein